MYKGKDKDDDSYNISETGNWNVAANYSLVKIMMPLANVDHYENIARFGFDTMLEQVESLDAIPTDKLRIIGFERLVCELMKIIDNSVFAMKKPKTKDTALKYRKVLEDILKAIPQLVEIRTNQRNKTKELKIIEPIFKQYLDITIGIKSAINEPLNKNHLIFTDKEEFDPQKYKEMVKKNAMVKG